MSEVGPHPVSGARLTCAGVRLLDQVHRGGSAKGNPDSLSRLVNVAVTVCSARTTEGHRWRKAVLTEGIPGRYRARLELPNDRVVSGRVQARDRPDAS